MPLTSAETAVVPLCGGTLLRFRLARFVCEASVEHSPLLSELVAPTVPLPKCLTLCFEPPLALPNELTRTFSRKGVIGALVIRGGVDWHAEERATG